MSIKAIQRQLPRSIGGVTGPSLSPLFWDETKLLLSMDYVGSSTVFQDNSKYKRNPTVYGNAQISNGQSKFGGFSGYFDGVGDYLQLDGSADFAFGTGDWTIEMWVYPTTTGTDRALYDARPTGSVTVTPYIYLTSSNVILFGSSDTPRITGTTTLAANTWYHVAVCKASGSTRAFVNGVQTGSTYVDSNSYLIAASRPRIGINTDGNAPFTGYIDDLRITKGVARYVASFAPPSQPCPYRIDAYDPAFSNTSMLLHAEGSNNQNNAVILDSSGLGKSVTRNGDVAQGSFSPFPVAAGVAYSPTTNIGSAYFDGTGDYLQTEVNSDFTLGTGDFTIEGWVYTVAYTNNSARIASNHNGWGAGCWSLHNTHTAPNSGSRPSFWVNNIAASAPVLWASTTYSVGAWMHVAVTRSGTTFRLFVNGVQEATATSAASLDAGAASSYLVLSSSAAAEVLNGYISNFHVVKGTALYTTNFSAPAAPATPVANTKLLLNFTNAAIYDSTGKHNLKVVGDTKTMVAQNKFGSSSMYFDGTGDYLTCDGFADLSFGTGDFTIEMWLYPSALNQAIIDQRATGGSTSGLQIYTNVSGYPVLYVSNGIILTGTTAITINTWSHLAVVKASGVYTVYLNGVSVGSVSNATSLTDTLFTIGATVDNRANNATGKYTGYIDDLRITKGVARYTGNFAVPSAALPDF